MREATGPGGYTVGRKQELQDKEDRGESGHAFPFNDHHRSALDMFPHALVTKGRKSHHQHQRVHFNPMGKRHRLENPASSAHHHRGAERRVSGRGDTSLRRRINQRQDAKVEPADGRQSPEKKKDQLLREFTVPLIAGSSWRAVRIWTGRVRVLRHNISLVRSASTS